jgi:hypothetical protein
MKLPEHGEAPCNLIWLCHDYAGKDLDSVVMTTQAKSRISHGLLVIEYWLTDPSADVVLVSIVLRITCPWT